MSTECGRCRVSASRTKAALHRLYQVQEQIEALELRLGEVLNVLHTNAVDEDALMMMNGVPHRFLPGTGWVNA